MFTNRHALEELTSHERMALELHYDGPIPDGAKPDPVIVKALEANACPVSLLTLKAHKAEIQIELAEAQTKLEARREAFRSAQSVASKLPREDRRNALFPYFREYTAAFRVVARLQGDLTSILSAISSRTNKPSKQFLQAAE